MSPADKELIEGQRQLIAHLQHLVERKDDNYQRLEERVLNRHPELWDEVAL